VGVPRVAACIIGAECEDKALADMLNKLLEMNKGVGD